MTPQPATHPWLTSLQTELDGLETALLQGDATGVERASARVHGVLQKAPQATVFSAPGNSALREQMHSAAQRFGRLRQAVLRASAQSQRAVHSLLPGQAQPTYGHMAGPSSTGGAGRAFLAA